MSFQVLVRNKILASTFFVIYYYIKSYKSNISFLICCLGLSCAIDKIIIRGV